MRRLLGDFVAAFRSALMSSAAAVQGSILRDQPPPVQVFGDKQNDKPFVEMHSRRNRGTSVQPGPELYGIVSLFIAQAAAGIVQLRPYNNIQNTGNLVSRIGRDLQAYYILRQF
jgi:hypothetical protein